jgi:DNA-binding NarL/FixJ family response regulator
MRILIVDDHRLFRDGLVGIIKAQPDFQVVGQASTVRGAIAKAGELQPDTILMDFGLPDGTGLEATLAILADRPETNIVFLTVHEEDDSLFAAIRSGAKGYLLKSVSAAKLLEYLRGLECGEAAISRATASRIMEEFCRLVPQRHHGPVGVGNLTSREVEVLRELATGASNQVIATNLVIAENTVRNHVHSILAKLNLRDRREAADFARSHGLVIPSIEYQSR